MPFTKEKIKCLGVFALTKSEAYRPKALSFLKEDIQSQNIVNSRNKKENLLFGSRISQDSSKEQTLPGVTANQI